MLPHIDIALALGKAPFMESGMTELVSVVIPTYNRAESLHQAIASVLSQSYSNFELIILDDGSTDATLDVVTGFALSEPRIKRIRHECNLGFVANWTYGVKLARGSCMAILGDDDAYKPDFLANRMHGFDQQRDVIAVTGPFECRDLRGGVIRPSRTPCTESKVLSGKALIDLCLGVTGEWFNGATLYKTSLFRSLWHKVMFAGTALDIAMHIQLSLLPNAKLLFLSTSDMYLRVHPGQESISNQISLAESAALMAIQLWHFKVKSDNLYLDEFRERFSRDLSHFARMLWDRGRVDESRSMFRQELVIDPYSMSSWLRYFRTYLASPKIKE